MPPVPFDPSFGNAGTPSSPFIGQVSAGGNFGDSLMRLATSLRSGRQVNEGYQAFFKTSSGLRQRLTELRLQNLPAEDYAEAANQMIDESIQSAVEAGRDNLNVGSFNTLSRLLATEGLTLKEDLLNETLENGLAEQQADLDNNIATLRNAAFDASNAPSQVTGLSPLDDNIIEMRNLIADNSGTGRLLSVAKGQELLQGQLELIGMGRLDTLARKQPSMMLDKIANDEVRIGVPGVGADFELTDEEEMKLSVEQKDQLTTTAKQALNLQVSRRETAREQSELTREETERAFHFSLSKQIRNARTPFDLKNIREQLDIAAGSENTVIRRPVFDKLEAKLNAQEKRIDEGDFRENTLVFNSYLRRLARDPNQSQLRQIMDDADLDTRLSPRQEQELFKVLDTRIGKRLDASEKAALDFADAKLTVTGPFAQKFEKNEALAKGRAEARIIAAFANRADDIAAGRVSHIEIAQGIAEQEQTLLRIEQNRKVSRFKSLLYPKLKAWFKQRELDESARGLSPQAMILRSIRAKQKNGMNVTEDWLVYDLMNETEELMEGGFKDIDQRDFSTFQKVLDKVLTQEGKF